MTKANSEQKLNQLLDELPKEMAPERDLWTGIERALVASPKEKRKTAGLWYGSAAAAVLLAVISFWPGQQQPQLQDWVTAMETQHQQQMNALLVSYADATPLTKDWRKQLDQLDDAARVIRKALEEEPENLALVEMLQQVYQKQIKLVKQVYGADWQKI